MIDFTMVKITENLRFFFNGNLITSLFCINFIAKTEILGVN